MRLLLLIIFSFALCSCVTTKQVVRQEEVPKQIIHNYEIRVVDIDGKPVPGARIKYTIQDRETIVKNGTYIFKLDEALIENVLTTRLPDYTYEEDYQSVFGYTITADNYYTVDSSESIQYIPTSNRLNKTSLKYNIKLIKPDDYFDSSIINMADLKVNILKFIDQIKLQGIMSNARLKYRSVGISNFKSNNYLALNFDNKVVFNSIRNTNYDIAKTIFDELIRKILNPLNNNISKLNGIYGYDINVTAYSKNFVNDTDQSKTIEYRYLIPEVIAVAYKNKDITGQQLLDKSIILMNDERIDLKLQ